MYGIIAFMFVLFTQGKTENLSQNQVVYISRVIITSNVKPKELVERQSVETPVRLSDISPTLDYIRRNDNQNIGNIKVQSVVNAPIQGFFLSRNQNTAKVQEADQMDRSNYAPKNTLYKINNTGAVNRNDNINSEDYFKKGDERKVQNDNATTLATLNSIGETTNKNDTTTEVSLDERASFDGDKCPTGHVRVNGKCVPQE